MPKQGTRESKALDTEAHLFGLIEEVPPPASRSVSRSTSRSVSRSVSVDTSMHFEKQSCNELSFEHDDFSCHGRGGEVEEEEEEEDDLVRCSTGVEMRGPSARKSAHCVETRRQQRAKKRQRRLRLEGKSEKKK
jgi:hypothetical protein